MDDNEKPIEETTLMLEGEPDKAEIILEAKETAKEGYLVKVVIKALPGDTRDFGPFSTATEASEVAEAIRAGTLVINFVLLPEAIETIVVEPTVLPLSEKN